MSIADSQRIKELMERVAALEARMDAADAIEQARFIATVKPEPLRLKDRPRG